MPDPTAHIKITREEGYWADRLRAYRIVLDRDVVASIHEGEEQELRVVPGLHRLHLSIDFCRSPMIEFVVQPNDRLALWCRPNARLLTWPFFLTFGRTHYIAIGYNRSNEKSALV
jgi:hypothetical protein